MTKYPTASLTADNVIFMFDRQAGVWTVLLVQRKNDPFKGMWALPGGFVNAENDDRGEKPKEAAKRELVEETQISFVPTLMEVGVWATPGRDPRGRVVTFAFIGIVPEGTTVAAADDAQDARWLPLPEVYDEEIPLAFDHYEIVRDALDTAVFRHWTRRYFGAQRW